MRPLVFHFPEDERLAGQLIASLDAEIGGLEWHRFPDRESLITLHGDCTGRDVIVVSTFTDPDAKSVPLYFASVTARELGARRVGLVAPYLGYMRQDHRFLAGQSRSAHAYAPGICRQRDASAPESTSVAPIWRPVLHAARDL